MESGVGWGGEDPDVGTSEDNDYSSYSQEAMDSALAASTQEMQDHNMEYGLAADPGLDSQGVGARMDAYTSGFPEAANTVATRNQINDFKDQGLFDKLGTFNAAGKVGQDRGFMGQAVGEMAVESGLNQMGSMASGGLLGMVGVKPGTMGIDMANRQAIDEDLGLVDRVAGRQMGALSSEATDSLVKRLMQDNRRRTV